MEDNEVIIRFNDVAEIPATREVLEDILNMNFIKNNLSIRDCQRIKYLINWFKFKGIIDSDNSFFYKSHEFALVKVRGPIITDKFVCFMTDNKHDLLIPWCSENNNIIEAGRMPPDTLLKAIDNYLDTKENITDEK